MVCDGTKAREHSELQQRSLENADRRKELEDEVKTLRDFKASQKKERAIEMKKWEEKFQQESCALKTKYEVRAKEKYDQKLAEIEKKHKDEITILKTDIEIRDLELREKLERELLGNRDLGDDDENLDPKDKKIKLLERDLAETRKTLTNTWKELQEERKKNGDVDTAELKKTLNATWKELQAEKSKTASYTGSRSHSFNLALASHPRSTATTTHLLTPKSPVQRLSTVSPHGGYRATSPHRDTATNRTTLTTTRVSPERHSLTHSPSKYMNMRSSSNNNNNRTTTTVTTKNGAVGLTSTNNNNNNEYEYVRSSSGHILTSRTPKTTTTNGHGSRMTTSYVDVEQPKNYRASATTYITNGTSGYLTSPSRAARHQSNGGGEGTPITVANF